MKTARYYEGFFRDYAGGMFHAALIIGTAIALVVSAMSLL